MQTDIMKNNSDSLTDRVPNVYNINPAGMKFIGTFIKYKTEAVDHYERTGELHPVLEKCFLQTGQEIDKILNQNYSGLSVVIRTLSTIDHHDISLASLIEKIIETGTDRINPNIIGRGYDKVPNADFFGYLQELSNAGQSATETPMNISYNFLRKSYLKALEHRVRPHVQNIFLVYDANSLLRIDYQNNDEIKHDAFKFKDSNKKPAALLGIIHVI